MTSTDTYQLKWHSHSSHLNGSVAALLRSERFTDVVLCTMDGSQIPAHKFILSSCSVYLCNLFEGQRSVTRMGGMLYVVLPSEISTKALKILVEYMYKGETTVSNEILDTVLKAGEVLKIRGLWRQAEETDQSSVEKTPPPTNILNKQLTSSTLTTSTSKKPEAEPNQPKITVKKDDKLLKTFSPMQSQNITRPMFIGPPKLVFIKTAEGATGNAGLRPIAPKGQTILVAPDLNKSLEGSDKQANIMTIVSTSQKEDQNISEGTPPRVLRKQGAERKYGKKARTEKITEIEDVSKDLESNDLDDKSDDSCKKNDDRVMADVSIKDEPDWDASSIEEEERSIAEIFHSEMNIKAEPIDDVDIEEENLVYSPLTCELCAEVFTIPAAWVRHIEGHANSDTQHTRKRKYRSASDDTEDTMALLRCDLCQKHFSNPAQWVRHIQNTHTEREGVQNKMCSQCKKTFPSHASMLIHMRTHTGERPFVCGLCNKGFNVKSNLLRHLRTLHDQLVSPGQVDDEYEDSPSTSSEAGGSAVKTES